MTTTTVRPDTVPSDGAGFVDQTVKLHEATTVTPLSRRGYANVANFNHSAHAPKKPASIKIERIYTTPGVHPYDDPRVEWELRDVVQTNWQTGKTIFSQPGVEFPKSWSINASTIVATKYFRGALGTKEREWSLKGLINRVVGRYVGAARENKYFASDEDYVIFEHELTYMLLHQIFAFNSPVWFNVGTAAAQQVSACFILSVDDEMDSILNWYREEGLIFKGGSGAGLNLSRIRGSNELLNSGGTASGPVSFMRGADSSAGTIKSGGATRRAAKMVVLDVDHPDVVEFIETKMREEEKIRVLSAAGFDMGLSGRDITSVQYQNANNSVRVSDAFMRAVADGKMFPLRNRSGAKTDEHAWSLGSVYQEVDACKLWDSIAEAAWACADPGVQYGDTINQWHTTPNTGPITASNPCSEYMSLDNSSCNLASLNLLKFLEPDNTFAAERFQRSVEIVFTAMDISICFADFPTEAIGDTTRRFRQLGIGYANLGALLMASGLGYDTDGGRAMAASITSLMTAASYRRSAQLAGVVGPYDGYAANAEAHQRVMAMHAAASHQLTPVSSLDSTIADLATKLWDDSVRIGVKNGWRNAQASLLAPTGTIGFMMDCDTTGIEPDFSLIKFKKLVGGGSMQIVNQTIPRALVKLGYAPTDVDAITDFISANGHIVGAPGLALEHYSIFDCAVGTRAIAPMGHILMMAAVQPFLSGAISKTVNLPKSSSVEDIREVYTEGWKLGLKAIAVYRDDCKVGQPLSDGKTKDEPTTKTSDMTVIDQHDRPLQVISNEDGVMKVMAVLNRRRMPKVRPANIRSFNVAGAEGYMIDGMYPDAEGGLGEVFLKLGKQGSTLAGVMDAFSIAISIALQYGVPLETYVSKFTNMRFEPAGMVQGDDEIKFAQSIIDYVFRRLAMDHLPYEVRAGLGIKSVNERAVEQSSGLYDAQTADETSPSIENGYVGLGSASVRPTPVPVAKVIEPTTSNAPTPIHSTPELLEKLTGHASDAPLCVTCGTKMRPSGSCYVCEGCGSTSGCS